jgi:hypothetical protein
MIGHRKPAPYALLPVLLLCVATPVALGQAAAPPGDAAAALTALKQAAEYERGAKRAAVVASGNEAVAPLIAAVEELPATADTSYVGNCIIALGELKAQEATDALITALDSGKMQIVYWAAMALANIWEGKGATNEQARPVNAALLGAVCSDVPPIDTLGPALALVKINGMPIVRPESLEPEKLADQVGEWFNANPAALPPADQRPWPVNLYVVLTSADEAARQGALQALRQSGDLGPIEQILGVLSVEGSADESVRSSLTQLLNDLTGVPFPPAGADAAAAPAGLVVAWKWQWFAKLSRQTDKKYVLYSWRQLEDSLRFYAESPSDDTAGSVRFYRLALLYQLGDPSAIPVGGSTQAKNLLTKPLTTKRRIADALAVLEGTPSSFDKSTQLGIIEDETNGKAGKEVCVLFLGRLARLAANEANLNFAQQLGRILSQVSAIPCDLERSTIERRRDMLTEWENRVREAGFTLEEPARTPPAPSAGE